MARIIATAGEEAPGAGWAAVGALPAERLRPLVGAHLGSVEWGGVPVGRSELPAAQVVLVVTLAGTLQVARTGSPEPALTAFVVGVGRSSISTRHDGKHAALEVRLSAPEAGSVFGVQAGELADRIVPLTDLWGRAAGLLVERLAEATCGEDGAADWQRRFALIEEALLERVQHASSITSPDPAMLQAHNLLHGRVGDLPMSALLEATGWSRRRLAEEFRRHVGLPPKMLARLVRFRHAERLLRGGGHRSFASVALTCGYYDQAHLNRDFLEMAGCTPTRYLARLQADTPAAAMTALEPGPGRTAAGTDVQDAAFSPS